jgi:hypothetical protein
MFHKIQTVWWADNTGPAGERRLEVYMSVEDSSGLCGAHYWWKPSRETPGQPQTTQESVISGGVEEDVWHSRITPD